MSYWKPIFTFFDEKPTANDYILKGFTILTLYYSNQTDTSLISYTSQLPDMLKTSNNQVQLIVQQLPSESSYATLTNYYVNEDIYNLTEDNLLDLICTNLLATSLECGLHSMNLTV